MSLVSYSLGKSFSTFYISLTFLIIYGYYSGRPRPPNGSDSLDGEEAGLTRAVSRAGGSTRDGTTGERRRSPRESPPGQGRGRVRMSAAKTAVKDPPPNDGTPTAGGKISTAVADATAAAEAGWNLLLVESSRRSRALIIRQRVGGRPNRRTGSIGCGHFPTTTRQGVRAAAV